MSQFPQQDIKFLTGVGPKKAEQLNKELQIFSYGDLLRYYPYKYLDRSKVYSIREIDASAAYIQLRGKITGFQREGAKPKERLVAKFTDGTGTVDLVFFKGLKYLLTNLKINQEYLLLGKPSQFNGQINFVHPELEDVSKVDSNISYSLQPFYNTTEKLKSNFLHSKAIEKIMATLWRNVKERIPETLPASLIHRAKLLPLHDALLNIHFPQSHDLLKRAQFRLKFEELFFIQLDLLFQKHVRLSHIDGLIFKTAGEYLNTFYSQNLPFPLTDAQKRVMKEIRRDLGSGKQMNRLLQGDVGSGKTLVALMTMLIAAANGYQSCLMVPTEILANQHFKSISKYLNGIDIQIQLLTGSTTKAARKKIHTGLADGSLHLLVGTHALLEDIVQFNNLGLVIIDEQHRFGVAQRAKLWQKNTKPPHILVMTATPIPRTLAMTVYGDLDVSVIDQLPPGRKPIQTMHYFDSRRLPMFGFLKKQIEAGRQAYIVYPLIKESENLDLKYLEDGYEGFSRVFPPPQYNISVVHGKMKNEEKDFSMRHFASGKAQIMIATTVIEVGVDVPNATVMVIENAERFGLSQLHQLRGRVGRGGEQSYCILMTSYKLSSEARKRIQAMVSTNDGFELAELDMKLRGPGDLEGTQQSGMAFDLKIANIAQDGQILQYARDLATEILEDDPTLGRPENQVLKSYFTTLRNRPVNWGMIS
ncbi:MAG: ATP-dependent DNA helicase RecG [Bacteroidota bacterium]|nr:ATP-dependent DNA helicase RecG [Bacteroidota bacterium]